MAAATAAVVLAVGKNKILPWPKALMFIITIGLDARDPMPNPPIGLPYGVMKLLNNGLYFFPSCFSLRDRRRVGNVFQMPCTVTISWDKKHLKILQTTYYTLTLMLLTSKKLSDFATE